MPAKLHLVDILGRYVQFDGDTAANLLANSFIGADNSAMSVCSDDTDIVVASFKDFSGRYFSYSTDDGATWGVSNYVTAPSGDNILRVAPMTAGYGFCTKSGVGLGVYGGFPPAQFIGLNESGSAPNGQTITDLLAVGTTLYLVQSNPGTVTISRGQPNYTLMNINGGWSTWVTEAQISASDTVNPWGVSERALKLVMNSQADVLLLTTHNLRRRIAGVWTTIWEDLRADVTAVHPSYLFNETQPSFVTDHRWSPFDRIAVDWALNNIVLGGPGGTFARSVAGGPFVVSSCPVDNDPFVSSRHSTVAIDGNDVYWMISAWDSINPCGHSIFKSTDGGATFSPSPFIEFSSGSGIGGVFPADSQWPISMQLVPELSQSLVEGCSDAAACNQDPATQYDDNLCTYATELRNCEDSSIINAPSADIAYLRPREGAFQFGYAMFGGVTTAGISISINGLPLFSGSFNLDNTTIQTQIDDFTAQLIAAFNAAGLGWRAVRTPALFNNIASAPGTWITFISDSPANNGASVLITGINITPNYQNTVDAGQASSTIKLNELDGCWTVMGPGDCNNLTAATLETVYEDCFRCVPYQPPMVCRDCDSMVTIDSTPIASSFSEDTATCVVAGQTMEVNLLIGFPVREQQNLIPLQVGTTCSPSCPITYTFTGDQTLLFQVGSTFQVNPSTNIYTVASSSYDSNADLTTVVTVEDCAEGVPMESVDTNTGCVCNAVVTVTDLINNVVVDTVAYPCVDGYISNTYTWVIPQEGRYLVTIVASYCGEERTCTYHLKACGEYIFREAACHGFDITIQRAQVPSPVPTHTIVIEDMATGAELVNTTVSETALPYRFTSPGDGVYKVTVSNTLSTTEVVGYIFDLCDTRTCREKLVKDLFCSCDDPCAGTECAETAERDNKRYLIQRVMLMWSELEAAVFTYRFQFLGIPTHTAERDAKIQDIALLVEKLQDVAATCGVCNDGDTESECTSC